MKQFAYFKITDTLTPVEASESLLQAKEEGFDNIIVLHSPEADLRSAKYKEKLLSLLRGAYRHKMCIYLADDSFKNSGTAFGAVCSVKDLWQKKLLKLKKSDLGQDCEIIEDGEECIVSVSGDKNEQYPYCHYPDLTNETVADMIIDEVYKPLVKEFSKFVGYEFKGFISVKPLIDSLGDEVVYSKEAVSMYKKELKPLFNKGKEYKTYMEIVEKCIEQSFVKKLKLYCRDNNMEYLVCGGEDSLNEQSLRQSSYSITDKIGNGYLMWADSLEKIIAAGINKMGAVLPIHPAMKKMEEIRSFLEEIPTNCPIEDIESVKSFKDRVLITNLTEKEKSVCLLFDDACVVDPETKETYPLEKTTYTFYPYSYLYIVRKKAHMYIDNLPVRAGGVRIGEIKEETQLEFVKKDNLYGFYVPEDVPFGKCVEFTGDFEYLHVRIGSMENVLVQKPFVMPLYGFLRGARGGVEAYGGEVTGIVIN